MSLFQMGGLNGQFTIWSIAHHSTDCEFNRKWMVRMLKAYEEGQFDKSMSKLLTGTFLRFFSTTKNRFTAGEGGFCFRNEKENSLNFIEKLKSSIDNSVLKDLQIIEE